MVTRMTSSRNAAGTAAAGRSAITPSASPPSTNPAAGPAAASRKFRRAPRLGLSVIPPDAWSMTRGEPPYASTTAACPASWTSTATVATTTHTASRASTPWIRTPNTSAKTSHDQWMSTGTPRTRNRIIDRSTCSPRAGPVPGWWHGPQGPRITRMYAGTTGPRAWCPRSCWMSRRGGSARGRSRLGVLDRDLAVTSVSTAGEPWPSGGSSWA